jgi:L-type amino acid transporter 6
MDRDSVDDSSESIYVDGVPWSVPDSPIVDSHPLQPELRSSGEFLISGGPDEEIPVGVPFQSSTNPPRSLTFIHGLALVIGLQIGSGIFSAPAAVRSHVSSLGLAMLAWIVGGIIAVTGAASFVILGKLYPLNGGIQEFLRSIYGDLFGFLFSWVWIFVSRPLALAMVSLIFSDYLFRAVTPQHTISPGIIKLSAILVVAVVTWLNCMGTRIGTGIGNVFLCIKVFGLGSIAIAGISVFVFGSGVSQESPVGDPQLRRTTMDMQERVISSSILSESWVSFSGFVEAILAAAFATGGWESVSNQETFEHRTASY